MVLVVTSSKGLTSEPITSGSDSDVAYEGLHILTSNDSTWNTAEYKIIDYL
jgi:hypothetical protein